MAILSQPKAESSDDSIGCIFRINGRSCDATRFEFERFNMLVEASPRHWLCLFADGFLDFEDSHWFSPFS